jgi:hypothetical protein
MAIFRQQTKYYEDGIGDVYDTLVLSDTFEGLFDNENAVDVDLLSISDIDQKSEDEGGDLTESVLTFEINTAFVKSDDEIAMWDFIKSTILPSNKVFGAVFMTKTVTYGIDDQAFLGVVQVERDEEDLHWHGNKFTSNPNPIQKVKLTARPVMDAVFGEVKLEHIIDGKDDIPGIDDTWISANVFDGNGWFSRGNRTIKVHKLVSLNRLFRKLADNTEVALNVLGLGELAIEFDRCVLPQKYYPARWTHISYNFNGDGTKYPRYVYSSDRIALSGKHFSVHDDDATTLALDIDNSLMVENPYETIFIDFKQIKIDNVYIQDPVGAKDFLWPNRCETFTDLIYKLATDLNLIVLMKYVSTSRFKITFVTREGFIAQRVHVNDVRKSNKKVKYSAINSSLSVGQANSLADEGDKGIYVVDDVRQSYETQHRYMPDGERSKFSGSSRRDMLLTISPTVMNMYNGNDDGTTWGWCRLPHNHYFVNNGSAIKDKYWTQSIGLHTAIYMFVNKREGQNNEQESYFTPTGKVKVHTPDGDKEYFKAADFVNDYKYQKISGYLDLAKDYEVPFLWAFSSNSDGSNPNWKNAILGNIVNQDGIEYIITGVTRDFENKVTKLKLTSKVAFEDYRVPNNNDITDPLAMIIPGQEPEKKDNLGSALASVFELFQIAEGNIDEGNLVALTDDFKIVKAEPIFEHYGRVIGIATEDGTEDNFITIQKSGDIKLPFNLNAGAVYLRYTDSDINISNTVLTYANRVSSDERLSLKVGQMVQNRVLKIDFGLQFIYE